MQRNFVTTEGTAVDVSYDVYDYNGDKLTDGTDYTAVIKNSNDQMVTTFDQLGDYTLTVTGMGNYSGSNAYTFSLVEWDLALMQDGSEHYVNLPENGTKTVYLNVGQSIKVYDSEGKDGKLVVSDGRLLLHVPTGYALVVSGKTDAMKWNEVQHETTNFLSAYENENLTDEITSLFGNSNNISFASAGNSMLIRLNAQKIYRYDDQYGLELTISVQKSLSHSDITIATIPDQTYSGSEICPAVIVNDGETMLALGTDYTVECADNVSAGTANMTITGAGNYVGTVEKTFEIVPKVIHASGAVQVLEDQDGKRAVIDGEYRGDGSVDIPENIKDVSVQFNRTFTVGKYSTIVLPFEIDEDKVMGADFYKIEDINVAIKDGDTTWGPVQISKVTGKIEANTPYLLKPAATRLDFVDAVTLNTSEKHPYGFTKAGVQWEFRGTYHFFDFGIDSTHLVGKSYGFAAKDQPDGLKVGDFRWTSDKSYILPMRGYLVYNEVDENKASKKSPQMRYAPRMSVSSIPETLEVEIVDADGGTTVIGQLDTRTGEIRLNGRMADRWFDMQGRVLKGKPTVKGRYLHNGKIEVIK